MKKIAIYKKDQDGEPTGTRRIYLARDPRARKKKKNPFPDSISGMSREEFLARKRREQHWYSKYRYTKPRYN